jgi:hypothetical protein
VGQRSTGEGSWEFLWGKSISCGLLKNDHKPKEKGEKKLKKTLNF